jgi:hypothetical protein
MPPFGILLGIIQHDDLQLTVFVEADTLCIALTDSVSTIILGWNELAGREDRTALGSDDTMGQSIR